MSLSIVFSRALYGAQAPEVRVETHLAPGLPAFHIVGLADTGVRESRERVRAAIQRMGLTFPAGRITVNLSPADLPKESGRFDLPIAIGILLAGGQLTPHGQAGRLARYVFAGELSLSGALVDIAAPLSIALAVAVDSPDAIVILPPLSAAMAARVPGLVILSAPSLDAVVGHLAGVQQLNVATPLLGTPPPAAPCLSDVKGQSAARFALEVAAVGGHSVLMSGSPGVGKSMLAQRLTGILPPLDILAQLAVSARWERAGLAPDLRGRPFRAPHHSATVPALVGGGRGVLPGEITLAHDGVLFLDELPEFSRQALEALREPLDTGWVNLSRAATKVRYPAKTQLVAAMNPCPCGFSQHPRRPCTCTPDRIARYRSRVSGPLLDRIDMQLALPACGTEWLDEAQGEASASVQARVVTCRAVQHERQGCLNADLHGADLAHRVNLAAPAARLLREAIRRWDWSARAAQRAMRVARSLADMDGVAMVGEIHLAQATQFRQPDGN